MTAHWYSRWDHDRWSHLSNSIFKPLSQYITFTILISSLQLLFFSYSFFNLLPSMISKRHKSVYLFILYAELTFFSLVAISIRKTLLMVLIYTTEKALCEIFIVWQGGKISILFLLPLKLNGPHLLEKIQLLMFFL